MLLDHVMQIVGHGQDVALLALEQLQLFKEGGANICDHAAETFFFAHGIKEKTPAESTRRGRRCPQTGGGTAGWCSCPEEIRPEGYAVYAEQLLGFNRHVWGEFTIAVLPASERAGSDA